MGVGQARACYYCSFDVPISSDRCPHCALPSLFPNVVMASEQAQKDALDTRLGTAMQKLSQESAEVARTFQEEVRTRSEAVIARPSSEVYRLVASDTEIYASFYALVDADTRLPANNKWDSLREAIDSRIFPYFKDKIRFAALTLNGSGLPAYGDCFLILSERMIEHRSTVFEENTVVFCEKNKIGLAEQIPPGYSATWNERGKLAAAKHGHEIDAGLQRSDFHKIILRPGTDSGSDRFLEVHIYGPISVRSIDRVCVEGRKSTIKMRALREKLALRNVQLVERRTV
jgi:hypothetical protein